MLCIDDYNALYSRTGYHEALEREDERTVRRLLEPEELRLVSTAEKSSVFC